MFVFFAGCVIFFCFASFFIIFFFNCSFLFIFFYFLSINFYKKFKTSSNEGKRKIVIFLGKQILKLSCLIFLITLTIEFLSMSNHYIFYFPIEISQILVSISSFIFFYFWLLVLLFLFFKFTKKSLFFLTKIKTQIFLLFTIVRYIVFIILLFIAGLVVFLHAYDSSVLNLGYNFGLSKIEPLSLFDVNVNVDFDDVRNKVQSPERFSIFKTYGLGIFCLFCVCHGSLRTFINYGLYPNSVSETLLGQNKMDIVLYKNKWYSSRFHKDSYLCDTLRFRTVEQPLNRFVNRFETRYPAGASCTNLHLWDLYFKSAGAYYKTKTDLTDSTKQFSGACSDCDRLRPRYEAALKLRDDFMNRYNIPPLEHEQKALHDNFFIRYENTRFCKNQQQRLFLLDSTHDNWLRLNAANLNLCHARIRYFALLYNLSMVQQLDDRCLRRQIPLYNTRGYGRTMAADFYFPQRKLIVSHKNDYLQIKQQFYAQPMHPSLVTLAKVAENMLEEC